MSRRRRRAAVLAAALAVVTVGPAWAAQEPPPDVPAADLAASVTTPQLEGSVTTAQLEGSVTPLERVEQTGPRTDVTLNNDVLFAFGSAQVLPEAAARLQARAAEVPPGAAVTVVGHTDDVGDGAANEALSLQRADAVAVVLRAAVPGLAVTTEGRGEREPVAPNSTDGRDDPEGRALNRRVVISYEG